ncbi:hypothetical protein KLP40_04280 [Hymenobacter sp. NST-14]|uniref:hypothetical protein n=1 Tax=Hymenobacter piscis TaxID=2839984 RepID=UPI001C0206F1|nr:hypothetical protein [Hymenobacter piscis]MBT9392371.1 hypothetical protein [Hymenobacter piscis]
MAVTIPANDRKAVWCIIVSFGIVLLANALYSTPSIGLRFSVGTLIGLLLMGTPVALVLWAVWRGQYWAKVLVILVTLYGFTRPLFHVTELQLPNYTPRFALLMLSLIPRIASTILLTRDLLRRPVAGEAGSHPIS